MPEIFAYSASEIDIATDAAMATLLWQAGELTDEEGNALMSWDDVYSVDDFAPAMRVQMREFLSAFMESNLEDLVSTGHVAGMGNYTGRLEQIGHDYVLTTGGHGAGFWDRGYGEAGDRLSEVCRAEGQEWSLYIGDDGLLYCDSLMGYGNA